MTQTYIVKPGDTLWRIARACYGYPQLWPSLYSFNNWAAAHRMPGASAIADPDRIFPGESILIPPLDLTTLRKLIEAPSLVALVHHADRLAHAAEHAGAHDPGTTLHVGPPGPYTAPPHASPPLPSPASRHAPAPHTNPDSAVPSDSSCHLIPHAPTLVPAPSHLASPEHTHRPGLVPIPVELDDTNPATRLPLRPFLAFEYDLDAIPMQTVAGPGWVATITYSGKILLQPAHEKPLVTLSNRGAVLSLEQEAGGVLKNLTTVGEVTWKPGEKNLDFSAKLVALGQGGMPDVAVELRPMGIKFSETWKSLTGRCLNFDFLVHGTIAIDVTLAPQPPARAVAERPLGVIPPVAQAPRATAAPPFATIPPRQTAITAHGPPHLWDAGGMPRLSLPTPRPMAIVPLLGVEAGLAAIAAFIIANPEVLALAVL